MTNEYVDVQVDGKQDEHVKSLDEFFEEALSDDAPHNEQAQGDEQVTESAGQVDDVTRLYHLFVTSGYNAKLCRHLLQFSFGTI